jgi:hypothetical protein
MEKHTSEIQEILHTVNAHELGASMYYNSKTGQTAFVMNTEMNLLDVGKRLHLLQTWIDMLSDEYDRLLMEEE